MNHIEELKSYFPLKDIGSIVAITKHLISSEKIEISVLSLLLGWYETKLTVAISKKQLPGEQNEVFPFMEWDLFSSLYLEYADIVELCRAETKDISNEKIIIKEISDFVWRYLVNPYFKDKHHIQNVHSFLKGKQLDCFGITITVLSILKTLGFHSIHLALSEDHAWLTYNNGTQTAEVTWHGKENKKKRGEPISFACDVIVEKCWLYLGYNYVRCDDIMELIAIVNAINPGINSKTDSDVMSLIQQKLLAWLYNEGHLKKFPIAICNLADLEEIKSSDSSLSIEHLYKTAIEVNENCCACAQVYPFTYYAGYLFRCGKYQQAITVWKKASKVVSRYNYSKEDEEVYKEFNEITNTMLPIASCDLVKDPITVDCHQMKQMFEDVLQYFDDLCTWEDGSKTPIFHETWAKSFIKILSTFKDEFRVENIKRFQDQKTVGELSQEANSPKLQINCDGNVDNKIPQVGESCTLEFKINESVEIKSVKMREIVKVLSQSKLNKNAIRLKLCANINLLYRSESDSFSLYSGRAKRQRTR